ncbi:hypothetical protein [Sphaerotilus mobilis]|uniref:Dyp-type peroxidase C-terminal domain-containing protein n=1 Tax=Sphaerotilus mobilis TaxID=47994 RepID=A0A4Q7LL53_9BURK|nr:hypothetical protein [Sphaerotilus mobilis]RZS54952.1 hypothetical protein EV685_2438 [Sphaerotilus mobilis]
MNLDDRHAPQRLAGCGYRRADAVRHLVLRIRDEQGHDDSPALTGRPARRVLNALRDLRGLRDAQGPLCDHASALAGGVDLATRDGAIDIGLTLSGLRRLGLPAAWVERAAGRSEAFRQGAAARAWRVGDGGPAAPSRWEDWARDDPARRVDLVLSLHAATAAQVEALRQRVEGLPAYALAFEPLACLAGERLPEPDGQGRSAVAVEHFGYRDGIARPVFVDRRSPQGGLGRHPEPVALGELLLGHLNEVGANPWDFRDLRWQDASQAPPPSEEPHVSLTEASDFFRGASFGVLRKMRQDVATFDAQVAEAANALSALGGFQRAMAAGLAPENARRLAAGLAARDAGAVAQAYIRAQFCGRWPGGSAMQPADGWFEPLPAPAGTSRQPDGARAEWQRPHAAPVDGAAHRACPAHGSHIRRMNPRDDPVVPPRRRVVLRRGLPYGRRGEADVGLLGLFFCASIEDQFEHLLGAWAQQVPMGTDHVGTARDPLIGQHDNAAALLEIWLPDGGVLSARFDRPSVLTRGTLYLLYPARFGLDTICGDRP